MHSLSKKLSFMLMALFIIMGVILAFIIRYALVQYNLEMTQRLNASIAMYVAEEDQLIANGQHNEAAIKQLAERAMVINPTVEVYLLDANGRVLSHNLPAGTDFQSQVPLAQIETFLQPDSHRPLVNLDPRSPNSEKAFSAAKITHQGQHEGYVYAILGGQTYEALAQDISKFYVLKIAVASIGALLVLSLLIGVLVVNKLTRPLAALTRQVRAFQQQITGEKASPQRPGDEIKVLTSAFQQMGRKIDQQMKQIQAADQNRRDLITNVSHDLRTPLASIQGYLDTLLIKHGQLDEANRQEYLATASKHCVRLNDLVGDLFELSKLDSLAVQPQIEAFSLAELIQDVGMEFKMQAQHKNIDLKVDLLDGPTEVKADIGLMQRVLENLIGNAIKHTPENGKVLLKLVHQDGQFKVIIRDTGRGISQQELPFIFDRLYRAENTSQQNRSSSGLGLAIVKKILDLHQSKIKVVSRLNQGTQFSFQLPVAG
ncbi:sensor histidine kinase [Marinicella meishanensis]|uniref:sensor histidine kinase n=1 Tax=Marinicella meishanensis TaxID=2873263 RepID=UPI001CBEE076|nr:HAMP domain-containing sensor histidine kinase [Marinicella sp. NBU2979]